jgi:signal transduction histidine kinase
MGEAMGANPDGPGDPAARALVLAPVGRDAAVLCRLLMQDGIAAEPCHDPGDLAARLREGAGVVVLTAEALADPSAAALVRVLAEQAPWSDLPVLLLDGGTRAEVVRALGHVTVLPRPARALAVVTAVRSALRARRRQYEVRDLLAQLEDAQAGLERRVEERTAELRLAQERALQAERLAAIGQTITTLAHEGRNALQRAHACLARLGWRLEGRPEELDLAGRTQHALEDLQRLFDDIRNFAAPIRLDLRPCDLGRVWRDTWSQFAALHSGRDLMFEEETAGHDLDCDADPFRLAQVFTNLFANALDACPDPVRVVVSCREARLGDRPALRVCVRDNGPGFTPEQRRQAFEAFYTTKAKGTGLGMAIVKRLVEAHGGSIAIEESAGGAAIGLTLPRQRGGAGPS